MNFEINANALAIAEFASCFDHRPEMIAIVEEAQFLGRMLRIEHQQCDAPITMRVSEHVALVGDITMSSDLAAKVLTSLGRHANESGQLPLHKLGTALEDHRKRRRNPALLGGAIYPNGRAEGGLAGG